MIETVNYYYVALFAAGAYIAYAYLKPKDEPATEFKLRTMKYVYFYFFRIFRKFLDNVLEKFLDNFSQFFIENFREIFYKMFYKIFWKIF